MWLSDRRAFLLGCLALPACGFTPAYAPGGAGQALRGQVRAADPTTSREFDFLAALEQRLGRPATPRFDLAYTISTSERSAAQVSDFGATRNSIFATLDYTLTERMTGDVVSDGRLRNFTNYSTTDTQLAVLSAQRDARARLMQILADQLVTRLLADLTE